MTPSTPREFILMQKYSEATRKISYGGAEVWQCRDRDGRPLVHRLDGPAITWPSGDQEWHIAGTRYHTPFEHAVAAAEFIANNS